MEHRGGHPKRNPRGLAKYVRRSVWDPETFAPGLKSRAEACPTGRAVSRERLGGCDGPMAV